MRPLIIRGPLGIGKSTIAKAVAEKTGGEYISVDQVLAQHGLDKAIGGGGIPLANFLKANVIITQESGRTATTGKRPVIDGNFYHKEQLENLVALLGGEPIVITLKAPVETCIARDAGREKPYGEDAVRAVHQLVSAFDYGTVVESGNQSEDETIQTVMGALG